MSLHQHGEGRFIALGKEPVQQLPIATFLPLRWRNEPAQVVENLVQLLGIHWLATPAWFVSSLIDSARVRAKMLNFFKKAREPAA
jgi:hypothetical protein